MAKFIEKWSVASVFNEWGMARFEDAYDCGFCAQLLCQTFGRASEVAGCIEELGYTVEIEKSLLTGLFIIRNISKTDENGTCINYYGSNGTETELDWKANYTMPLSGDRTINHKAVQDHYGASMFFRNFQKYSETLRDIKQDENYLHNITPVFEEVFPEGTMEKVIEDGAYCNKFSEKKDSYNDNGVSTIGNTLPQDIVEALRDFRSEHDAFIREPNYEFYIPGSVLATNCCPCDTEHTEYNIDNEYSSQEVCCPGVEKEKLSEISSSSESDED